MDSSQEHFESQQPAAQGVVGDLTRARTHGAATAAELREFLGQLKGRSPQEVMGIVAQSSLVQGITTATFACAVLLFVFTVGPYVFRGDDTPTVAATDGKEGSTKAVSTVETTPTVSPTVTPPDDRPNLEKAADAMGIGETTTADPASNPLDKKLDSLLDGIE